MISRVQNINSAIDISMSCCIEILRDRSFQTTFYGERRVLCVKRSCEEGRVVTIDILLEAISRYQTQITITGKLTERSSLSELATEVAQIADILHERGTSVMPQPSAFPLHTLQVCIA